MYEGTRYIFSSFEALEDIVLFGKRTTLYHTTEAEAVLYEHGDEKMFVLVNLTQEPQTVKLDDLTGTWHEFRHDRMICGNTFRLKPLETVIGTNVIKDAGMPTYQETEALINKLEYERTHRGSLLFNRGDDIAWTSSKTQGWGLNKLFDGVQDNISYTLVKCEDQYFELGLEKVVPTFTKVALYGDKVQSAVLKVKQGDAFVAPEVVDVQTEEFVKIMTLKEPVTAEYLRMEFDGQEAVELYELELH
jgi:hypothetical protein